MRKIEKLRQEVDELRFELRQVKKELVKLRPHRFKVGSTVQRYAGMRGMQSAKVLMYTTAGHFVVVFGENACVETYEQGDIGWVAVKGAK